MSEEMISLGMFKLWTDSQDKMINAFIAEMKEVKKEQQETNVLLREDINTTKSMATQHRIEYENSKQDYDEKFKIIFNTLRSRESFFITAKWLRIGLGIILAGALTAAGTSFWNAYYTTSNVQKLPSQKQEIHPK